MPPTAPAQASSEALVERQAYADNQQKLAVVVLITRFHYKGHDRIERLRATIRLAEKHLLPTTPYALYVFTRRQALLRLREGLTGLLAPHMYVLPVPPESWVLPEAASNKSTWHGYWGQSYRQMGDWRLGFMGAFACDRGHRYVLQMDDDSYITGPVGPNLVELFDRGGHQLGAQRIKTDPPLVTGLPELVRYFLMAYQLQPATLFKHCDPPSMAGLYSSINETWPDNKELEPAATLFSVPTHGGWDRTVLNGNFVMISLDFWFQPLAFIQLCRASGGAVMYRWNEQAVLGMVSQIFVAEQGLYNFTFPFMHRASPRDALRAGGLSP
ncbi:hypothetical protein TSOC_006237 [Tetrabaena socialis]|uniref:Hexosyltransferase n=1 Tax=Tetrabaena socialis TaxID=47790 RepID=A0A2J8A4A9_9CHLO|nr:hypothetical protein TSOC_006237 [Tetrabaena socialis]|eukprot:PNH07361.1 hypothetical protein TSOC_006237 [Tetrabaena socialis]